MKNFIDNIIQKFFFTFLVIIAFSCSQKEYDIPQDKEIESFKNYTCYYWRGTLCIAKLEKKDSSSYCNPVFVFYSNNKIDSINTKHFDKTLPQNNCSYDLDMVKKISEKFLRLNNKTGITRIWYDDEIIKYNYTYDMYNHLPEVVIPLSEKTKKKYKKDNNYNEIMEKGLFIIK